MSSTTFNDSGQRPVYGKNLALITRARYFLSVWIIKALVWLGLRVLQLLNYSTSRAVAPTCIKRYQVRPMLECRVFFPKDVEPDKKIPLYISIHGGGFTIGEPSTDDHISRHFADEFGYCVVSPDYRKAPLYPWPIPVQDCIEVTRAIIEDDNLPIDRNKIVIGGFSAGANLSFAVAQSKDVGHKIKGIVAIVPPVDFTGQHPREYKVTKDGRRDPLKSVINLFKWAYAPLGVDLRTATMSPIFATRKMLPHKIYFVTAEYDCLCKEANIMAKQLAGIENDPDPGSEWEKNGIRWEMVPDQQHPFTHMQSRGKKEVERKRVCTALFRRIDDWVKAEVF